MADLVNAPAALARLGGNQSIFTAILGTFLRSDALETLRGALALGDADKAAAAAHAIKGAAGNLGLDALYQGAIQLEEKVKADGVGAVQIEAFEAIWRATQEEVKQTIKNLEAN